MTTTSEIIAEGSISVCDIRCWEARENICRCRCVGLNHGIAKFSDTRPQREKRKGTRYYKLVGVGSHLDAYRAERNDRRGWSIEFGYKAARENPEVRYPHERILINKASKGQLKWAEVEAGKEVSKFTGADRTYLVWERTDTPAFWTEYVPS